MKNGRLLLILVFILAFILAPLFLFGSNNEIFAACAGHPAGYCTPCNASCCCGCSGGGGPGCQTETCDSCMICGCHAGALMTCCDPDSFSWVVECCGGGGCFTGETEIGIEQEGEGAGEQEGETKEIKDLQPGDIVSSFDPETGEIREGTVSDVTKTTREGYYILETESGKKVKVTAEHPFLAVKNQGSINQVSNFKDKLINVLSNTLTYKLITGLQAKVSGILR